MKLRISIFLLLFLLAIAPFMVPDAKAEWNTNYNLTGLSDAEKLVAVAMAQDGKLQADLNYELAWCAYFVRDCASKAGVSYAVGSNGGYAYQVRDYVLNKGGYKVSYNEAKIGDIVTVDWAANGGVDHVEIVYKVENGVVYTISGNYTQPSSRVHARTEYESKYLKKYITAIYRPAYNTSSPTVTTTASVTTYETNAFIKTTFTAPRAVSWAPSGIILYKNGSPVASMEWPKAYTLSTLTVTCNINTELNYTLTPGTTYTYLIYTYYDQTTRYEITGSFTTKTVTPARITFKNTLVSVGENSFTIQFLLTADREGCYTEFGLNVRDDTFGNIVKSYSSTTLSGLGKTNNRYFNTTSDWTPYRNLKSGNDWSYQYHCIFDGVTYYSDWYSFHTLDTTAPRIDSVQISDVTKEGYRVVTSGYDAGFYDHIVVKTWPEGHEDEAVTHTGWYQYTGLNSYSSPTTEFYFSEFRNRKNCYYFSKVTLYDREGNASSPGTAMTYVDGTPPRIEKLMVTDADETGFWVTGSFSDDVNLDHGVMHVWTPRNSLVEAGDPSDDEQTIVFSNSSIAGNSHTFRVYINYSDHNGEIHTPYQIRVVAYDSLQDSLQDDNSVSDLVYYAEVPGAAIALPASLQVIEESSMEGIAAPFVVIPEGCSEIGSRAFARCTNLRYIYIPQSVTSIAPDAFSGSSPVILSGLDSAARYFAQSRGLTWVVCESGN